jgi:hypothetical protein
LQAARLSASAIRAIQKIIRQEQAKKAIEATDPVTAASQGSSEDEPKNN